MSGAKWLSRLGFLFLPSPISRNNFRPRFERMSLTALIVLRAGLRARVLGPQDDGEGVKACAKDTKMAGRPGLPMRKALQRDKQGGGSSAAAGLGDRIDLIVDGGACEAGVESTIIAPGERHAVMLRPGAVARAEIELFTGPLRSPDASEGVLAPGMMKRHYAPRARLRMEAMTQESGEAFLAFGPPPPGVSPSLNLSIRGDLAEAASNLFAMLRALDARHAMIAVQTIPDVGLGEAINDRLRRGTLLSRESGV